MVYTLTPVGDGSGLYHEGEQGALPPPYSPADNLLESLIKSRLCILEVLSLKFRSLTPSKGYFQAWISPRPRYTQPLRLHK